MPLYIMVDGVPFFFLLNSDGWFVGAVGQNVDINGSPIIITFDPPIAPTVNANEIYEAIKGKLG